GIQGEEGPEGPEGAEGIQGPIGPKGDPAAVFAYKGEVNSIVDLPAVGAPGDAYTVVGNTHLYLWDETLEAFIEGPEVGAIQGPKGDQGEQGPRGQQGLRGEKGETGASIIFLNENPGPLNGRPGDMAINNNTKEYFRKNNETTWISLGYMEGGTVHEVPEVGLFIRNQGGWTKVLEGGDLTGLADGGQYVLTKNGFARFDGYDTAIVALTGTTIDPTLPACNFTYQVTGNTTLTVANFVADRSKVIILRLLGNAGTVVINNVQWGENGPPEIGTDFTVIALFWDGVRWYGSLGPAGALD
ncbi:MAG: collagen-like protein, partial [Gammaproteobacteria bacterium]|nr:collagen-like protein [Gammaproteobacteria bacterium]